MQKEDLAEIYREIADRIGVDTAIAMHDLFQGQQVQFPQKLYNKEYTYRCIKERYNGHNIRELAQQFGYSDRRIRQILKDALLEEI